MSIDASIDPGELDSRTSQPWASITPSVVTIKVEVQTGANIETAALQCVGIARLAWANVEFQFEDMIVLVRPCDEPGDVVRRCQKRKPLTKYPEAPRTVFGTCGVCDATVQLPDEPGCGDGFNIRFKHYTCPECLKKQDRSIPNVQYQSPPNDRREH